MRIFALLITILFASLTHAQTSIEALFEEARGLNYKKDFYSAAKIFAQIEKEALKRGDAEKLILSITAEGECYYMLNLIIEMKDALERAQAAYCAHADKCDKTTRLYLQESISKLEGSYHSCTTDTDPAAYSKAHAAFRRCLHILDTIKKESTSACDDKEPEINIHRELLSLYYKEKQYDKALEEADEVFFYRSDIGYDENDTTADGKRDYDNYIDAYISRAMVLARLNRHQEALELLDELPVSCNEEPALLRTKGKILMLQYAHDGTDNRRQALWYYNKYITLLKKKTDKQISTLTATQREQYWLSVHDFLYDCYSLGGYAPDLLYNLALYSKGRLNDRRQTKETKWSDIRRVLKKDECAVEFVQYRNTEGKKQLAALIVKNNYQSPLFVDIASVQDIVSTRLKNGEEAGKAITNDIEASKDALYSDTVVAKKIWNDEILKHIRECKNIYFAPDGILHRLAIEYLYPESEANCHRLTSTRTLTQPKKEHKNNIIFFGGIDYNAQLSPQKTNNDIIGYNKFKGNPIYINPLNGTETEVDSIYLGRKRATAACDTILKGDKATDEALDDILKKGYSIVHIATHGYFSGENRFDDLKPRYRDEAMSESGLMMAGAAENINNHTFDPTYSDGILTAKELSSLNLSGVSLVVLSACQTGLGHITEDGIYGIQRALKTAGAEAMILSLWSVDDAATMEFMRIFYNELNKDKATRPDIHKAFNAARTHLLQGGEVPVNRFSSQSLRRRKTTKKINAPRYANAFILIDAL